MNQLANGSEMNQSTAGFVSHPLAIASSWWIALILKIHKIDSARRVRKSTASPIYYFVLAPHVFEFVLVDIANGQMAQMWSLLPFSGQGKMSTIRTRRFIHSHGIDINSTKVLYSRINSYLDFFVSVWLFFHLFFVAVSFDSVLRSAVAQSHLARIICQNVLRHRRARARFFVV